MISYQCSFLTAGIMKIYIRKGNIALQIVKMYLRVFRKVTYSLLRAIMGSNH